MLNSLHIIFVGWKPIYIELINYFRVGWCIKLNEISSNSNDGMHLRDKITIIAVHINEQEFEQICRCEIWRRGRFLRSSTNFIHNMLLDIHSQKSIITIESLISLHQLKMIVMNINLEWNWNSLNFPFWKENTLILFNYILNFLYPREQFHLFHIVLQLN